ncbi:MAG: cell division protein ZapA [Spirochaetales bacterium]|nr:cell division protein ZapA [Spirochaetales bacterium]
MAKSSLEVDILGTRFTIQSRDDQAYLEGLVAHLGNTVRHIQERYPSYEPVKVSLLAALNITDELFRCRNARGGAEDPGSQEIEQIAERLIDTIDRSLAEN